MLELIDHETTELMAELDRLAIEHQFQYSLTRFQNELAPHLGRWRCVIQHGYLAYHDAYCAETFRANTRKEALAAAVAWVPTGAANYTPDEEE